MKLIVSLAIVMCVSLSAIAQHTKSIDLGISVSTGRNFYDKKYYDQPRLAPGWETNYKTNYLWSIGAWVESYVSPHFSILTAASIMEEDVPENMLCQCNTILEVLDTDEKHHWATMEAGMRYYIKPSSKLSFFVDGEAEINWLVAARTKRYFMDDDLTKTYVHWNAFGYKRFIPSASLSLGAKWKRLTLSVGGMTNLYRAMIRNPGTYDQVVYPIKTGFFGKGFFLKTTFTLIKLR